jgi:hypothetical protein
MSSTSGGPARIAVSAKAAPLASVPQVPQDASTLQRRNGSIMSAKMKNRLRRLCLLAAFASTIASAGALAAPICAVYRTGTSCSFYDMDVCQFATAFSGFCMFNEEETRPAASAPFCVATRRRTQCSYYDSWSCREAAASVGGTCVAIVGR